MPINATNPIIQEDLHYILNQDVGWDTIYGSRFLISGANGFLPAYLVETLLALNDRGSGAPVEVLALVRNRAKAEARFRSYLNRSDLTLLVQDVCEPIEVDGTVDYLIHAASQASPKYYSVDPVGTLLPNVRGTENLLRLGTEKNSRSMLFFSTSEVYGEISEDKVPTREHDYGYLDPLKIRSCYAESKRLGETLCISWMHQFGLPVKIVRPYHTYGPRMDLADGRVFADFVADILAERDITLKSDGLATRAFCYLADATVAFLLVLLKGKPGHAYNVGNDSAEITIRALAHELAIEFPERKRTVIMSQDNGISAYLPSTVKRSCPDTSAIRNLGWIPRYNTSAGFRRTVESFRFDATLE